MNEPIDSNKNNISTSGEQDIPEYEIELLTPTQQTPNDDTPTLIPFSYANKQGIFYENNTNTLYYRSDIAIISMLEVFRLISDTDNKKNNITPPTFKALSTEEFLNQLENYYANRTHSSGKMADALMDESAFDFQNVVASLEEPDDLLASEDEAPVIRLLNAIFFEAIRERASDIHVEVYEKYLFVRFRIDGVLQTRLQTKPTLATLLVTRIKVLSRLDIAEKRLPQDGRIGLKLGGRVIDLRVSTLPSAYGERVVMRLLDRQANRLDLESLGMPEYILKVVQQAITRPNGIFLVTGPTGSGKTTTLYAALQKMDKKTNNIMTIEDPIEYYFDGISQTQVNNKADMSFARGLRAILRQDPDIVMIGEIRDAETAKIAVQASLTGHLVLSTVHTNSAVGSITRLIDMGVEQFLLASTLRVVLAQRLVRGLCQHCHISTPPDEGQRYLISLSFPGKDIDKIYHAKGCPHCNNTGYIGRIGVYEIVVIDDTVRQMITENKSELEIANYVFGQQGNFNLRQSAFSLVLNGRTSYAEAVKITF